MTAMRLMTEDNVVQFPAREASTFEQAWSCRAGMMKKRGDGSDKTRKLWERHAKKVGSARLLEALKRYLREEKEPQCGYPGLSVWLNGERYDHWLTEANASGTDGAHRKQAPEPLRTKLLGNLGEAFVRSYVDPAEITDDGWIIPRTGMARDKLMEQKNALKAAGLVGIRQKA